MKFSRLSYGVRAIGTSIISINIALTQTSYAQAGPLGGVQVNIEPTVTTGPKKAFRPSDGFIDAAPSRYNFCPAARVPGGYGTPGKQMFEGDAGWFFQASEINWNLSLTPDLFHDIARMSKTLGAHGTKLVILVTPPRALTGAAHLPAAARGSQAMQDGARLRTYLNLLARLRAAGAVVPDMLEEARRQNVPFDRLTSPADIHWSTTGAWVAALAVTRSIAPERLKGGAPEIIGTPGYIRGKSYISTLNRICGTKVPPPAVRTFTLTEPAAEAGGDLLGESTQESGIVLVGTSFSALTLRYSFAPFLERSSGLTTVNLSISGGGPLTAIKQYTGSADFRASKPKYLVWELVPSALPDTDFTGERGGILRGQCSAKSAAKTIAFGPGAQTIANASNPALLPVGDGPMQLDLGSDNPAFRNFSVYYDYIDGRQRRVDIDTRRATAMEPNYTVMLPDDHALIGSISVASADPLTGQLTARLCAPAEFAASTPVSQPSWLGRVAAWFKSLWS